MKTTVKQVGAEDVRVFYKSLMNISHASITHHWNLLPTIGKCCIYCEIVGVYVLWGVYFLIILGCIFLQACAPVHWFKLCMLEYVIPGTGIKSNQVKFVSCPHPSPSPRNSSGVPGTNKNIGRHEGSMYTSNWVHMRTTESTCMHIHNHHYANMTQSSGIWQVVYIMFLPFYSCSPTMPS